MNSVFDTLFLPINQGLISAVNTDDSVGIFNAQMHPMLNNFSKSVRVQQNFKPYADQLKGAGFSVEGMDNFEAKSLDIAFIHAPQNRMEAEALIAQVALFLKDGGSFICVAENKAGGNRLAKLLAKIGLSDVQNISKNKARVCFGVKNHLDMDFIQSCIKDGAMRHSSKIDHMTQPGIFGWDKVDVGSKILAGLFEKELTGRVADFGCGYGYLSVQALQSCDKIRTLYGFDADIRAVETCRLNCEEIDSTTVLHHEWVDLMRPAPVKNLDHIIMNPPFHAQKKADVSIGVAFIKNAHAALAKNGVLWMVANAHLPYEAALNDLFLNVEKPFEGKGFKVFMAQK